MRSIGFLLAVAGLPMVAAMGCGRNQPIGSVQASPAGVVSGPPRIQIARADRDLGEISLTRHVETFEIRNLGQEPLIIRALEKSCGCLDVHLSETTVPRGAIAHLKIAVAPRQPEERSASLTVHSNDPTTKSTRIVLSWTARGPISVEPRELIFGTIRPGVAASRTLRVKQDLQQLNREIELKLYGTPAGLFTARRLRTTKSEHSIEEEWSVDLLIDRETIPSNGQVFLSDYAGSEPLLQIPATWHAREAIDISPPTLFLGTDHPSRRIRRSIDVTCDADKILEIGSVEHIGQQIAVEFKTVIISQQLARIEIEAVLPDQPGTYLEQVRINCRAPFVTTLELPLSCVVQSPPGSKQ